MTQIDADSGGETALNCAEVGRFVAMLQRLTAEQAPHVIAFLMLRIAHNECPRSSAEIGANLRRTPEASA